MTTKTGVIWISNGGILKTAAGKITTCNKTCCCLCPDAEPSATVTVAGACPDDATCKDAAGAYLFDFSVRRPASNTCCYWDLRREPFGTIYLNYEYTEGKWYSTLLDQFASFGGGSGDPCGARDPTFLDVTEHITCSEGVLSGTYELPGLGPRLSPPNDIDCTGCTATVTLT